MAREHIHPPSAACLSASMRDLGYSLETAIADLVDNSISAGATWIKIICDFSGAQPLLVILDNGKGMTEEELLAAMRHGTNNPTRSRAPTDLGRFGLGLKTASFSQCRSLTVVARSAASICGAEWDLDRIDAEDDWVLSILDDDDIKALPYVDSLESHGTAVIWQKLDRLLEDEIGNRQQEIVNEKLEAVRRHLSLVFHRFLSGEVKGYPKIDISINGSGIRAFDPFCRSNRATQVLPEEVVPLGDAEVRLQPYILPHHSRLTKSDYYYYQDRSDFISNQGAYVYRNGRLMAWGDWFRLIPKGEATKLARVQIDFPNSLDESWTIDIKKSRARPPFAVRERLRHILSRIIDRSVTVHRGRGRKLYEETCSPLWERYADHDGIRYEINIQHPIIVKLSEKLSRDGIHLLLALLDSISSSIPIETIYSDYATNPREVNRQSIDENEAMEKLRELRHLLFGDKLGDPKVFVQVIRSMHLFDDHMSMVDRFVKEIFK